MPTIAEILSRIPRDEAAIAARAEARREQLAEAYKQARRQGKLPPSPIRSVLEEKKPPRLNGATLSRHERLKLGIEVPHEISPVEREARLEFLRKQAEMLRDEKAG